MKKIFLTIILLAAGVAHADAPATERQAEAAARYQKAVELYQGKDFKASLVEFRRAYQLDPSFSVLYNIGQVYDQLGDFPNALGSLSQYLVDGGANVPQARRAEVEKDLEALRGKCGWWNVQTDPPGATLRVDDLPAVTVAGRTYVMPGKRKLTVSLPGYADLERLQGAVAGQEMKVIVLLSKAH